MSIFLHEEIFRGAADFNRLKLPHITICGAGALGANILDNLARMGFQHLSVIDMDRIEQHNLSTQPYQRADIGAFKARIMANSLYRALGLKVQAQAKELTEQNVDKLLKGADLVLDCFDNSGSRGLLKDWGIRTGIPVLHVGLAADYAEVIWNAEYRVPSPVKDDICDYPLARSIVMLAVSVATETVVSWALQQEQRAFTITLGDFAVRPYRP